MGQAKNRGSFETRVAQSLARAEEKKIKDEQAVKDWEESLTETDKKELIEKMKARTLLSRKLRAFANVL